MSVQELPHLSPQGGAVSLCEPKNGAEQRFCFSQVFFKRGFARRGGGRLLIDWNGEIETAHSLYYYERKSASELKR
jgi:D-hexose-6-phosphate mutarotase